MTQQDTETAQSDAEVVREAIQRAQVALDDPERPDLSLLERELRGHAAALLPLAEAALQEQWRTGSFTACLRRSRLDSIRYTLAQPPAEKPLAAHTVVSILVTDCRVLLDEVAGGEA